MTHLRRGAVVLLRVFALLLTLVLEGDARPEEVSRDYEHAASHRLLRRDERPYDERSYDDTRGSHDHESHDDRDDRHATMMEKEVRRPSHDERDHRRTFKKYEGRQPSYDDERSYDGHHGRHDRPHHIEHYNSHVGRDGASNTERDHKGTRPAAWWGARRRGMNDVAKVPRDGSLSQGEGKRSAKQAKVVGPGKLAPAPKTGDDVDSKEINDLKVLSKQKEAEHDAGSAFMTGWFSKELSNIRDKSDHIGKTIASNQDEAHAALKDYHKHFDAIHDEHLWTDEKKPIGHPGTWAESSIQRAKELEKIDKQQEAEVQHMINQQEDYLAWKSKSEKAAKLPAWKIKEVVKKQPVHVPEAKPNFEKKLKDLYERPKTHNKAEPVKFAGPRTTVED